MWTYLSEPYALTFPGVHTEELGDWREDGEAVDSHGLIRRRDYSVDISADSPAAHYSRNHRVVDGIVLPMNRIVYARDDDGQPLRDMVTVTIDIDDVTVT